MAYRIFNILLFHITALLARFDTERSALHFSDLFCYRSHILLKPSRHCLLRFDCCLIRDSNVVIDCVQLKDEASNAIVC